MHNAALRAVGLHGWRYQLLPVPPGLLEETVRALPAAGFRGVNVTIPHKEAALALAAQATDAASSIGAANTLSFDAEGAIEADNTDAPALIGAIPFAPAGRTALVLGAGGSARAVVWALRSAGASEVRIWNRHTERAEGLADELGGVAVDHVEPADLLVNCTPVGMDGDPAAFKQLPVRADEVSMYACVVDLVYSHAETPLISAANARGVPAVDGLELLVRQGAHHLDRRAPPGEPLEAQRPLPDEQQ